MLEVGIQGWTQQIHDHEIVFTLRSNPSWVSWRFGVLVETHRVFVVFFAGDSKETYTAKLGNNKKKRSAIKC